MFETDKNKNQAQDFKAQPSKLNAKESDDKPLKTEVNEFNQFEKNGKRSTNFSLLEYCRFQIHMPNQLCKRVKKISHSQDKRYIYNVRMDEIYITVTLTDWVTFQRVKSPSVEIIGELRKVILCYDPKHGSYPSGADIWAQAQVGLDRLLDRN